MLTCKNWKYHSLLSLHFLGAQQFKLVENGKLTKTVQAVATTITVQPRSEPGNHPDGLGMLAQAEISRAQGNKRYE